MKNSEKFEDNVSLLICSKNRKKEVRSLVDDLQDKLKGYNIEILVVEETDKPSDIRGVRYVPHPISDKGIGYARNLALEHSSGEIVVFIDDDCTITDGWLSKLLKPLGDPHVLGVQGGVIIEKDSNIVGWAETLLGFPGGGLRRIISAGGKNCETIEVSTLNCAYRKKAIIDCGGFDERLKLGSEDYLLAKQICKKGTCIFVPDAVVMHEQRGSLVADFDWFVRRGRAEIGLIRSKLLNQFGYKFVIRSSIIVKLFLILFFLSFSEVNFACMAILAILLFVVINLIKNAKIWYQSDATIWVFLVIPIVKLTMDFGCDIGRIVGIFYDH